jgi:hypothetical protein
MTAQKANAAASRAHRFGCFGFGMKTRDPPSDALVPPRRA